MHWNLNYIYITEIWYKNGYTLKDSIYKNHLHKYYKCSSSNINFIITT